MSKKENFFPILGIAIIFNLIISYGAGAEETTNAVSNLKTSFEGIRVVAYETIKQNNKDLIQSLIEIVQNNNDSSFYGSKSLAIQLLGELRAEQAVDVLLKNLIFCPLDRIVEEALTQQHYYIAAVSLVKIGIPSVANTIAYMRRTSSVEEAEICAWIIQEILGKDATMRLLGKIAEEPDKRRAKRGTGMMKYISNYKPIAGPPIKLKNRGGNEEK